MCRCGSAKSHDLQDDFWPIQISPCKMHNMAMKNIIQQFGTVRLIGLITVATVAIVSLYISVERDYPNWPQITVLAILFAAFLGLEVLTTRSEKVLSPREFICAVVLQLIVLFSVFFTAPYTFVAILLGIWCGNLLHFMKLGHALATTPLLMFGYYAIFTWHWDFNYMMISSALYWMLCLFTVTTVNSWVQENLAKEASEQLNRELLAAQSLLKEATRQSERVRIARDIHDLVGHHLTALTINLQVATHQTEGPAKQQIEKSYAIAKLLLSDVREAVTEIREKSQIELRDALEALINSVPRLKVNLTLDEHLDINNVELADAILRCVQESLTNTLKHSNGDHFSIRLYRENNVLTLAMQDNGQPVTDIKPGNGLQGMKERIAALGGSIQFYASEQGFRTAIQFQEAI